MFLVLIIISGIYLTSDREVERAIESQEAVLVEEDKKELGLKFAVMADVHSEWGRWRKLLEKARDGGNEMVIIAGDLASEARKRDFLEAKKVLDGAGLEYYVVPGNHDWRWGESRGRNEYGEVFEEDYMSFKKGEVKFILVNNGGYLGLGEKQWAWLREETKECEDYFCVAVMHMPLNHNFLMDIMGRENERLRKEASELLVFLRESGIKDIITGHMHYSTSYELDGVRTYIVGAVGEDNNPQGSRYTEFEFQEGKLGRKVVTWEELE